MKKGDKMGKTGGLRVGRGYEGWQDGEGEMEMDRGKLLRRRWIEKYDR